MKKSRYTLTIERDNGELVIYSAISGAVLRVKDTNLAEYQAFCAGRLPDTGDSLVQAALAQARDSLREAMILLDDSVDELNLLAHLYAKARHGNAHTISLCIAATMRCNLTCPYCFNPRVKRETMSRTVMADVANFFSAQLLGAAGRHSTVRVAWTGGEPLYDLEAMKELSGMLHGRAREHDCTYSATVISNGTLLTGQVAAALSQEPLCVQSVQVTLDGPKRIHDTLRIPGSGHGTFDTICANIRQASEHLPITIRVGAIPEFEASDFELLLDELFERSVLPGGGNRVSMFLARVCPCKDDRPSTELAIPVERFAALELECARIARKKGYAEFRLPVWDAPSRLPCGSLSPGACAIDNKGFICGCIEMLGRQKEALGRVAGGYMTQGDPESNRFASTWETYNPFIRINGECADCPVLPICAGGCPLRSIVGEPRECSPAKHNLEERILFHYLGE